MSLLIKDMDMPKNCKNCFCYDCWDNTCRIKDIHIDNVYMRSECCPIVEVSNVKEVKYGNNITSMNPVDEFICSECGFTCEDLSGYDKEEDIYYEYEPKFCPECGADMRGA